MAEFQTPTKVKSKPKSKSETNNPELHTPMKIPASPFLQKIGYGTGMAVYMLERSPKVGFARSPWALKLIKGKNNKAKTRRLRSEADILRQLNHPNIVGFRAFIIGEDGPGLAMEALDMSLGDKIDQRRHRVEDKPFPANNIIKVGFEIAKGLKYLHHTAHILHGDIKSWNILVSHNFDLVKLCDFGTALPLTESLKIDVLKEDFVYVGTESWNPPEVVFENQPVTSAADIWTYGLTLWEMISLLPPHCEETDKSVNNLTEVDSANSELDDSKLDMDMASPKKIMPHKNNRYGTRPALPAIKMGKEYDKVLEIFYVCTTSTYKLRPNAKALVNYFEKCGSTNKT